MCVFPKMIKWKVPAVDDGGGLDGQGDEPHHVRQTNRNYNNKNDENLQLGGGD